ncbi:MAG: hypothetical protein K9J13_14180 [Saprospiraceae bacterium]|nr:hypothetical protein [Saprospiraceae bacterium]
MNQKNKLVIFQTNKLRRLWHYGEWYYSVVDIFGALTDSVNPTDYLKKFAKEMKNLGATRGQIVHR